MYIIKESRLTSFLDIISVCEKQVFRQTEAVCFEQTASYFIPLFKN